MKRRQPDTRPRWNDPNLTVVLHNSTTGQVYEFSGADLTHLASLSMDMSQKNKPEWRDDPAYNMRRKK